MKLRIYRDSKGERVLCGTIVFPPRSHLPVTQWVIEDGEEVFMGGFVGPGA